jgi:hypothetical protein
MSQLQSPLLRLPAELRNQIYQEVFDTAILRHTKTEIKSAQPKTKSSARFIRQAPALALVCKQLYHETEPFLGSFTKLAIEERDYRIHYYRKFRQYVEALKISGYNFGKVQVLEVDAAILNSMERFHSGLGSKDEISMFAQAMFPALDVAVLPSHWFLDPVTRAVVRFCFRKPDLSVSHN